MMNAIPITTLLNVDPSVARRAQRLQFAIDLLDHGIPEKQVRARVKKAFDCSYWTAQRTVTAAKDLAS